MTNPNESRPAAGGYEATETFGSVISSIPPTSDEVCEHRGVLAHSDFLDPHHFYAAWASGTARFWRARAEVWLAARPRPDDFHGRATPEDLAAQWDRLTAKANACKARAEVAERYGCTSADMALVVGVTEVLVAA